MSCEALRESLDEWLDGDLGATRSEAVRNHLAACPECRGEEASLRHLLAGVEALPASLPPREDLWPGIEARLAERQSQAHTIPSRDGGELFQRQLGLRWRRYAMQALAALFLVALGVLIAPLLHPFGSFIGSAIVDSRELTSAGDTTVLAAEWPRSDGDEFQLAEGDLLRAKEKLRRLAERRRGAVSASTRKVIDRNLRIIDRAIDEVREALEEDPGNRRLRQQLLAHHRREIDLLKRLGRVRQGLS